MLNLGSKDPAFLKELIADSPSKTVSPGHREYLSEINCTLKLCLGGETNSTQTDDAHHGPIHYFKIDKTTRIKKQLVTFFSPDEQCELTRKIEEKK